MVKENRTRHGADEQELEAITREIHAQLRALYDQSPTDRQPQRQPEIGTYSRPATEMLRFALGILLPLIVMVGLGLVLRLVKDGF